MFSDTVNDLHPLLRQKICKKLDIKHPTGGAYRELAAYFDMSNDDINAISQNPDPTDNVLQWVGRNPKNTIAKLRKVLKAMGRKDCVNIIDEDPPSGKCYFMVKLLYKSFERQTKIKPANFSMNPRRMLKPFSCLHALTWQCEGNWLEHPVIVYFSQLPKCIHNSMYHFVYNMKEDE